MELLLVGTLGDLFSFQQVEIFYHRLLDWSLLRTSAQTELKSIHN